MSDKKENVNSEDNSQGKNLDQNNNSESNQNQDGDKKPERIMIPKERLDEESTKRQEAERKLAEYQKKDEEAEAKKLEEQGEFKTLLEKERAEKEKLQSDLIRQKKLDAIKSTAIKNGANNPDVMVKLLDLDKIQLSEDGSVDLKVVEESLNSLKESEPYLFGGVKAPNIGGEGGAPEGGTQTVKQFNRSQIKDTAFYRENEKDIIQAMKTGNIVDDVN